MLGTSIYEFSFCLTSDIPAVIGLAGSFYQCNDNNCSILGNNRFILNQSPHFFNQSAIGDE
jgi:hypothetical protein